MVRYWRCISLRRKQFGSGSRRAFGEAFAKGRCRLENEAVRAERHSKRVEEARLAEDDGGALVRPRVEDRDDPSPRHRLGIHRIRRGAHFEREVVQRNLARDPAKPKHHRVVASQRDAAGRQHLVGDDGDRTAGVDDR